MRKLKQWILICSTILMLATLFFWTLFIPPLSELEGAESMGQLVVFVPSMILFPVILPLIWILEIFCLFKLKQRKVKNYFFMVLSCAVPIVLSIIYFTIRIPILILYVFLSIVTISMVVMSFITFKNE